MDSFIINGTEFGVDNIEVSFKKDILNLSFTGDKNRFDEISEDDDSEWSWAMDAPEVYFNNVSLNHNNCLRVDWDSELECAVYMMEHNALSGILTLNDTCIVFVGEVDLMGDVFDISFRISI